MSSILIHITDILQKKNKCTLHNDRIYIESSHDFMRELCNLFSYSFDDQDILNTPSHKIILVAMNRHQKQKYFQQELSILPPLIGNEILNQPMYIFEDFNNPFTNIIKSHLQTRYNITDNLKSVYNLINKRIPDVNTTTNDNSNISNIIKNIYENRPLRLPLACTFVSILCLLTNL